MSVSSLWQHAPRWRVALMGAVALSIVVAVFPPVQRKGVTSYPNGRPDIGPADYTSPPPPSTAPAVAASASPPTVPAIAPSAATAPAPSATAPSAPAVAPTATPTVVHTLTPPISPPYGSTLTSSMIIAGKTMSLPGGQWTVIANVAGRVARYANIGMSELILAHIQNKKVTGLIVIMAATSDLPNATGFHVDGQCLRSDVPASDASRNEDLGDQRCWVVTMDDVNGWKATNASGVFKSALADLDSKGLSLPRWMASSYNKVANKKRFLTMRYMVDPAQLQIGQAESVSEQPKWSKYHLAENVDWAQAVDRLAAWSKARSERLGAEFLGGAGTPSSASSYSWPP